MVMVSPDKPAKPDDLGSRVRARYLGLQVSELIDLLTAVIPLLRSDVASLDVGSPYPKTP